VSLPGLLRRSSIVVTLGLALSVALLFSLPSRSLAIPLDDPALIGTPMSVGPLTFTFTKVESIALNLSAIDIAFGGSGAIYGFDLTAVSGSGGGMHTENGVTGDVKLEFSVHSALPICAVSNKLVGYAINPPPDSPLSSVSVSELIAEDGSINLGVVHSNFHTQTFNTQLVGNLTDLTITKNLVIAADTGAMGLAEITHFEQRYTVLPEPGAALLFVIGGAVFALPRRLARAKRRLRLAPPSHNAAFA
jgi:hypothetical protein